MTDPAEFRAQFPVFDRLAYLNAGTEGPMPRAAADAIHARVDLELQDGRSGRAFIEGVLTLATDLRAAYARVLCWEPGCVALTGSTTDGVNTILSGLAFSPGDEIVTSDEEHPGLLAPLGRLQRMAGVRVRVVPFAEVAAAVDARTRLVACSHVSWVSGRVVDTAGLRASGVPVLLDGAQGLGAVPTDVAALGATFYAGSGQKWLCGPEGSGALYVAPEQLDALTVPWPGYGSLADAHEPLTSGPAEHAARFDLGFPPPCAAPGPSPPSACSNWPAGRGSTSDRPAWPPSWRRSSRRRAARSDPGATRRSSAGWPTTPMPRWRGSPGPGSSCAASRRTGWSGCRSGHGRRRRSSTGSSSWPERRRHRPQPSAVAVGRRPQPSAVAVSRRP